MDHLVPVCAERQVFGEDANEEDDLLTVSIICVVGGTNWTSIDEERT